jgi:lipoic acid synthetase
MRRPEWLRKKRNLSEVVLSMRRKVQSCGLHTVCELARCPNLAECYGKGVATIMILGDRCTRHCRFCNVEKHGVLDPPDGTEGKRIAHFARENNLSYLVITSVTRDDLSDGGASHFVRVIGDVKRMVPQLKIEVLVPDFKGRVRAVEEIVREPIDVFGHNMETTEALYPTVRPGAKYSRSLKVLAAAYRNAEKAAHRVLIKSAVMVGLGETEEELMQSFEDLARLPLDILTIGQYLQPSKKHLPVSKYYTQEEFKSLERLAKRVGIRVVKAGSYVRSSYLAEESYRSCLRCL